MIKYNEFLLEKRETDLLEYLLEGKMSFSTNFLNILKKVDSPISDKISKLSYKDVDINTNYIDVDITKNNVIEFIPETKIKGMYEASCPGGQYGYMMYYLMDKDLISSNQLPIRTGEKASIYREVTKEELQKSGFSSLRLVIISFGDKYDIYDFNKLIPISEKGIVKRSELKIGRFAKGLLKASGEDISDKEIEDFVNKWKSTLDTENNLLDNFEEVSGDDIKYYYNGNRYLDGGGSLNNSCMRYTKCQSYFDIYTDNKDCKLIVFKEDHLVRGRALLWKVRDYETKEDCGFFMDRVYTANDSDVNLFIEYANIHGYMYKSVQGIGSAINIMKNKLEAAESQFFYIICGSSEYDKYPYADTMQYFGYNSRIGDTILTNNSDSYDITLDSTDGGTECEECGGSGEITCGQCDGDGREDCDECSGGNVTCNECDGAGELSCDDCSGNGKIDCRSCEGTGKDSEGEYCTDCGGNGRVDCYECDGDGNKSCNNCDGDGDVDCENCSGNGRVDCSSCDGNGEYDCPECN